MLPDEIIRTWLSLVERLLWGSEGSAAGGRKSDPREWQRSIKSRKCVSPQILSGTATGGEAEDAANRNENKYPGVAQLVARLLWEQDAASSSLATWTKSTEFAFADSVLLL